jgi:hypothetical protein
MQTAKGKKEHSIESKMFKMLKDIGVELSLYHGGLLNGKDTKKVMKNATYFFDGLAVILKEGKRDDSHLSDNNIDMLCLHFWEVFVLWDGAFLLARTVNPMENDTTTYLCYVVAAVNGHKAICCTVTPKVHLMLKHVAWQIRIIPGGVGKKWKIGSSKGIKPGCVCKSASALSRTRPSAQLHGRRQVPVHRIPM